MFGHVGYALVGIPASYGAVDMSPLWDASRHSWTFIPTADIPDPGLSTGASHTGDV